MNSARILTSSNGEEGSPVESSNIGSDVSPGIIKVIDAKEMDGIVEESNMNFGKNNVTSEQNFDMSPYVVNPIMRTSTKTPTIKQARN